MAIMPASRGMMPSVMKNVLFEAALGSYMLPRPINTITTANTGNTESAEFTRPLLLGLVLSATHALKAASFDVEPATVIMQSNTTSSVATSARLASVTLMGSRANSIIVNPHAI